MKVMLVAGGMVTSGTHTSHFSHTYIQSTNITRTYELHLPAHRYIHDRVGRWQTDVVTDMKCNYRYTQITWLFSWTAMLTFDLIYGWFNYLRIINWRTYEHIQAVFWLVTHIYAYLTHITYIYTNGSYCYVCKISSSSSSS